MESPVFEEFEPASDCDCPACVHRRSLPPNSPNGRRTGRPGPRALVVAAAASTAVGLTAAFAPAAPHTAP